MAPLKRRNMTDKLSMSNVSMSNVTIPTDALNYISDTNNSWNSRDMIPEVGNIPDQTEYSFEDYVSKLSMYAIEGKTDSEIINTWTAIEKAMSDNRFSESHLKDMLECALNLRGIPQTSRPLLSISAPCQDFVFSTTPNTDAISADLTSRISYIYAGGLGEGDTRESSDSQATAICYICCLYMRLITKPTDHIEKALTKLKRAYGVFYGKQSTLLSNFRPRWACPEGIQTGLRTYKAIAGTLSYHLGTAEASLSKSDTNYALCRFLLFEDTEMMGMKIYKMSVTLLQHMKQITPARFLTFVENDNSEECTKEIRKIAMGLDNPNNPTKNYYWKYARMVDPTYFLNLSISCNKYLAVVLAKLLKQYGLGGTKEYDDGEITAVLKNLEANVIKAINKDVRTVVAMYEEVIGRSGSGGLAWRLSRGLGVPTKRARTGCTENTEEQTESQNQQQQTPPTLQEKSFLAADFFIRK
ncbi:hypothetical protein OWV82_010475 [Melia azedarach]|uniref:Uncharacterized protein n=1 Tax=Melia azedarach TaxID=155640 RepID=A0ACC1Y6I7_MELAZ|nr:hypothetical protein OWV82_010475 [Melia azedarach]